MNTSPLTLNTVHSGKPFKKYMTNHQQKNTYSSKTLVHVAVGVLLNERNDVLIAKRADHQHQGGLWEFPGGKVEHEETAFNALVREFQEEVGVTIIQAHPFMEIRHHYSDKHVLLDVWISRVFSGNAVGKEDQQVLWVPMSELARYDFPEANQSIIEKLIAE